MKTLKINKDEVFHWITFSKLSRSLFLRKTPKKKFFIIFLKNTRNMVQNYVQELPVNFTNFMRTKYVKQEKLSMSTEILIPPENLILETKLRARIKFLYMSNSI